jgi:GTP 3',8-cyclase
MDRIATQYTLTPADQTDDTNHVSGPAKEYITAGSDAKIGFITTMSDHFCGTCNRIRLTADGRLRTCLFARDGIDLKRMLRAGAPRDAIEDSIRAAVLLKWQKHPEHTDLIENQDRTMTSIGG